MGRSANRLGRRILGYGVRAGVAILLIGAMTTGITFLHWRADAEAAIEPSPALPVVTMTIELQDSYPVEQRFAGRLEPRRETSVSFERDGLVTDVLVEEGDPVV